MERREENNLIISAHNCSSQCLLDCLDDIRRRKALNFLHFNDKKTDPIIFKSGGPNSIPTF